MAHVLSDTGAILALEARAQFPVQSERTKALSKTRSSFRNHTWVSSSLTLKPWVLAFHQADAHIRRGTDTPQNCLCHTEGKEMLWCKDAAMYWSMLITQTVFLFFFTELLWQWFWESFTKHFSSLNSEELLQCLTVWCHVISVFLPLSIYIYTGL